MGGRLVVTSPCEGGTRLEASIPQSGQAAEHRDFDNVTSEAK
jgi:hypothetical protein